MKKKKTNKKITVIILNIIAVLFAIYSLVKVYMSYTYISSLVAQGLVISQELLNVIDYYVSSASPYVFYAIATWAIGCMIKKLDNMANNTKEIDVDDMIIGDAEILIATDSDMAECAKFETVSSNEADALISEEDILVSEDTEIKNK